MAELTSKTRNALPDSSFAGPDRSYPVNDKAHAINAKARAEQQYHNGNLSGEERDRIIARANRVIAND